MSTSQSERPTTEHEPVKSCSSSKHTGTNMSKYQNRPETGTNSEIQPRTPGPDVVVGPADGDKETSFFTFMTVTPRRFAMPIKSTESGDMRRLFSDSPDSSRESEREKEPTLTVRDVAINTSLCSLTNTDELASRPLARRPTLPPIPSTKKQSTNRSVGKSVTQCSVSAAGMVSVDRLASRVMSRARRAAAAGDEQRAARHRLFAKIEDTLRQVTRTVVNLSTACLPLVEDRMMPRTAIDKITMEEKDGKRSKVGILKYKTCKTLMPVLTQVLRESLCVILQKIKVANKTLRAYKHTLPSSELPRNKSQRVKKQTKTKNSTDESKENQSFIKIETLDSNMKTLYSKMKMSESKIKRTDSNVSDDDSSKECRFSFVKTVESKKIASGKSSKILSLKAKKTTEKFSNITFVRKSASTQCRAKRKIKGTFSGASLPASVSARKKRKQRKVVENNGKCSVVEIIHTDDKSIRSNEASITKSNEIPPGDTAEKKTRAILPLTSPRDKENRKEKEDTAPSKDACRRVISQTLKNSLMILQKINEASKTVKETKKCCPRLPELPPPKKSVSSQCQQLLAEGKQTAKVPSKKSRSKRKRTVEEKKLRNVCQVQVKTTGPSVDMTQISKKQATTYKLPTTKEIIPDTIDTLTLDQLPPIKSEYPRRDHHMHTSVENTFLFKLVRWLEPEVKCGDLECSACSTGRGLERPGAESCSGTPPVTPANEVEGDDPLNLSLGKKRTPAFNFNRYMANLERKHVMSSKKHRVVQAFPVSVRYNQQRPVPQQPEKPKQVVASRRNNKKRLEPKQITERHIQHQYSAIPTPRKMATTLEAPNPPKSPIGADLNTRQLHEYVENIEQKFLQTFSMTERDKANAYQQLESEIKETLESLQKTPQESRSYANDKILKNTLDLLKYHNFKRNSLVSTPPKNNIFHSQNISQKPILDLKKNTTCKSQPTMHNDCSTINIPLTSKNLQNLTVIDTSKNTSKLPTPIKYVSTQCIRTESFSSSDFDTICEETESEQSVIKMETRRELYFRLEQHLCHQQNIIFAENIIELQYTIDHHNKKIATVKPITKRMIDFLEVITSISFESLHDDVNKTNIIIFYKRVIYVIQKYCISQFYFLSETYQQTIYEYTDYIEHLIEKLSKSTKMKDCQSSPIDDFRLMSFKQPYIRKYSYSDYTMLDKMLNSIEENSFSKRMRPIGHTMVVNLQLSNEKLPRTAVHSTLRGLRKKKIKLKSKMDHGSKRKSVDKIEESRTSDDQTVNKVRGHVLFWVYVITFIVIFLGLMLNFKCE